MKGAESETHTVLHSLLAERAQLQARIYQLTVEIELARQMTRTAAPVGRAS